MAVRGPRRRIDLGRVNDRYFFTTASIGLSVQITEELTGKTKQRWGPLAYGVAAIRALTRSRAFHADISWPGGSRHSRTVQIVVGNGRYYGSTLPVAADARIDDARLDLYSLEVRHWLEILALAPSLKRGRHGSKDSVEALRSTEFEITTVVPREINVDGEIWGNTPARFRVCAGALEVFAPAASPRDLGRGHGHPAECLPESKGCRSSRCSMTSPVKWCTRFCPRSSPARWVAAPWRSASWTELLS